MRKKIHDITKWFKGNDMNAVNMDHAPKHSPLKTALIQFFLLTAGALVFSVGVALFLDSNDLASGGITGLAVILSRLLPLKTGTLILIFNVPILIIGAIRFKLQYFLYTLYATYLSSSMIDLTLRFMPAEYVPMTGDILLAAVVGGAMMGAGMGLVFHGGGSTGGSDVIIKLLRQKYPHVRSGTIFLIFDIVVVAASAFLFGVEHALYAGISVVVASYVMDIVLYGGLTAKFIYIISTKSSEISQRLLMDLNVGVTKLNARGGYTGNEQTVLICAFHKHHYQRIRDVVKSEDPAAFMIVTSAHEVFGEGFQNPFADEM